MIEKVEAWKDSQGRLWFNRTQAVQSEFSTMLKQAIEAGPSSIEKHKAEIIAVLTGSVYQTRQTRKLLLEALLWYEENRGNQ